MAKDPWDGLYWSEIDLAIEGGHLEATKALLKAGAQPSAQGRRPTVRTPQSRVRSNPLAGRTQLTGAAKVGRADICRALIAAGADPNERSLWGRPALHIAAQYGHVAVCEVLIAAGANVMVRDGNDLTALHAAAEAGRANVCAVLLQHRARVNAADAIGRTPMHLAALMNRTGRAAQPERRMSPLLVRPTPTPATPDRRNHRAACTAARRRPSGRSARRRQHFASSGSPRWPDRNVRDAAQEWRQPASALR